MEEKSSVTLENIQRAALDEFLDKGFLGASLRQIVKNAGVTTGGVLRVFFQQGSPVRLHCGTSRRGTDGPLYAGADNLRRIT